MTASRDLFGDNFRESGNSRYQLAWMIDVLVPVAGGLLTAWLAGATGLQAAFGGTLTNTLIGLGAMTFAALPVLACRGVSLGAFLLAPRLIWEKGLPSRSTLYLRAMLAIPISFVCCFLLSPAKQLGESFYFDPVLKLRLGHELDTSELPGRHKPRWTVDDTSAPSKPQVAAKRDHPPQYGRRKTC